jgi:uncharacterized membrane protein
VVGLAVLLAGLAGLEFYMRDSTRRRAREIPRA